MGAEPVNKEMKAASKDHIPAADDVIGCLLAEKPFWFDPATNFVHADDGGGRGTRWEPVPPETYHCGHCDGTGDVHGIDGEWKGQCDCSVGDGTERLCQALYGRKATARDYVGGSDAKMLHDAADRIAELKANGVLAHARAAERDQECFRLEDELKGALELINAQNANAATLREMFGQAKERALTAEFAIAACARFLKEGETPEQRIERLHGEISGMMKTLAAYTDRALAAEAKCDALREALAPFAKESLFAGPQHEFVTIKLSDCDRARARIQETADVGE